MISPKNERWINCPRNWSPELLRQKGRVDGYKQEMNCVDWIRSIGYCLVSSLVHFLITIVVAGKIIRIICKYPMGG